MFENYSIDLNSASSAKASDLWTHFLVTKKLTNRIRQGFQKKKANLISYENLFKKNF